MASEVLNLTAQIVSSHASMTELSPKELVQEIKAVYRALTSLEEEIVAAEAMAPAPPTPETASRQDGGISRGQGG